MLLNVRVPNEVDNENRMLLLNTCKGLKMSSMSIPKANIDTQNQMNGYCLFEIALSNDSCISSSVPKTCLISDFFYIFIKGTRIFNKQQSI